MPRDQAINGKIACEPVCLPSGSAPNSQAWELNPVGGASLPSRDFLPGLLSPLTDWFDGREDFDFHLGDSRPDHAEFAGSLFG